MSIAEGCASSDCGHGQGCDGGRGGCEDDCTNTLGKWGAKGGHTTPSTNSSSGVGVEKRKGLHDELQVVRME